MNRLIDTAKNWIRMASTTPLILASVDISQLTRHQSIVLFNLISEKAE